ncbi:ketopantoate reductase family protein [Streptomyces sp. NPDC002092]
MANDALTVAVLGPGGIGGLLAGLLSRAGHRVICLAGETTATTLRTDGIRVRSGLFGDFTARTKSSMQRDAEAGRPLELDAIGGALLRAAERHGVSVPVTARVVRELADTGR